MRLRALSVDGFGLFHGRFECRLPGEIALIVGGNETGKSTLVAAIGAILFGLATESEKARFAPANTDAPRSGWLEVESEGKAYRFARDFRTNRTTIESLGESDRILFEGVARPGGRSDEKEQYSRLLNELFGMESRDLFCNSVFVEQGKLPAKIDGIVRRIVSGSPSADYEVVRKNLKDACEQLTVSVNWGRSAGRKPRLIEQLDEEIRKKSQLFGENRSTTAAIDGLRGRLKILDEQLTDIEKEFAEKTEWQKKLKAFSEAAERKKTVEENLNRCRKEINSIDTLEREKENIESVIQRSFTEYVNLPPETEKELAEIIAKKKHEEDLQERRRRILESSPKYKISAPASVVIAAGIALAAGGIAFLHGSAAVAAVLVGLALLSAPFILAAASFHSQRSTHGGKLNEIDEQLQNLLRDIENMRARYPLLKEKNIPEVLERLRELRRLEAEKQRKEDALKQHANSEDVTAEFNACSNDLLTLNHHLTLLKEEHPRLTDIEREGRPGLVLEQITKELIAGAAAGRKYTKERDDLRYQLAAAEGREIFSEEALEEEIEERQAQLERLKLQRAAYLKAVEALEESISEFHASHLSRIQEATSEHLSAVTKKDVRVYLNQRLEPLYVEESGLRLTPDQLSQGTRDQLDFSLRLAAIDAVCDNIRLPIILDDPFVNFDEERLGAVRNMLAALSASHQIILLTHDRRYCEWRQPALML